MTIISTISGALDKVQFPNRLDLLPLSLSSTSTSFRYLEPFFANYKDTASSFAVIAAILATSYYVYTNVLNLDKPKGYRDIPNLSSWKTIYYQFKAIPTNVKYTISMKDTLEKYGIAKVTQFGKKIVYIANPEYARQMLMDTETFPKVDFNKNHPTSARSRAMGENVAVTNGDVWRRQRRVCNPAFHRSWSTETFGERSIAMIDRILSDRKDGILTTEMAGMAKRMTLDALGKIAFDYDFNSIENPQTKFSTLYRFILTNMASPLYIFFPSLENVPFFRRNELRKAIDLFDELLFMVINAKREKLRIAAETGVESNDSDLLSLMIKANGNESLTDEELRANMFVFFIAGHDTTANSVACALCYIANNPKIQEKLHKEITDVLGPSDATTGTPIPTLEESKNMKYLNAIIKETMRLNPSVEQLPPREVTKETIMGPYTLPVGVNVILSIYGIQLDAKYWDRPEEFDPDRFMNEGNDCFDNEKNDLSAWLPFSGGSRICLGMNFSLIEQRVAIAMLVHRFKLSLPADSPHKKEIQFNVQALKEPKNLQIEFTPRF